jgi:hypothetical protein
MDSRSGVAAVVLLFGAVAAQTTTPAPTVDPSADFDAGSGPAAVLIKPIVFASVALVAFTVLAMFDRTCPTTYAREREFKLTDEEKAAMEPPKTMYCIAGRNSQQRLHEQPSKSGSMPTAAAAARAVALPTTNKSTAQKTVTKAAPPAVPAAPAPKAVAPQHQPPTKAAAPAKSQLPPEMRSDYDIL